MGMLLKCPILDYSVSISQIWCCYLLLLKDILSVSIVASVLRHLYHPHLSIHFIKCTYIVRRTIHEPTVPILQPRTWGSV